MAEQRRFLDAPPQSEGVERVEIEDIRRAFKTIVNTPAGQLVMTYLRLRLARHRFDCTQLIDPQQIHSRQGRAAEVADILAALDSSRLD